MKILLLFASLAFGQTAKQAYFNTDFSGGLNTQQNGVYLKDNQTPSAQNVLFDVSGGITRRKGSTKVNASAIGGGSSDVNAVYQLERSNGNRYCVAFSSTNGYSSTDACQTFTTFVSTLTRNNDVICDSLQDRLYCVNNQYNFYFDGTNDINVSAMPANLDFIRVHRNRCFAAGNDAQPSRLYWSNLGDCTAWTTSTDYVDVSPQDGDVITGIGEPFFDTLPVYKKFSTWLLKGFTPETFVLVNVSKNTGAKNHRAIANFGQMQLFDSLGPNGGQPGIYGFNGTAVLEVSRNLRGDLDGLDTFHQNAGRRSIDTKGDFDAGTFDTRALSSAREPGFMESSYTAFTDTLGVDFAKGTLTNVSTTNVSNSLSMTQSPFANAGAESNDMTNWPTMSYTPLADTSMYGSYIWNHGSNCACPLTLVARVEDASGNILTSSTQTITNALGPTEATIDTSLLTPTTVQLRMVATGCSINPSALSSLFIRPNNIRFMVADSNSDSNCGFRFDVNEKNLFSTSGNLVSQTFYTGISTPIWGLFQATISSSSTGRLTFETQVATSSNGAWDALISATPGSKITSAVKPYIRYKASFAVDSTTNTSARLDDASLSAASTGTWTSAELFLSNNLTSWGLFNTDQSVSGAQASLAYAIRSSTYSGGTASASWSAVTANTAITIATGPYIQVISTVTVGVATETAKIDDIVINWSEGAQAKSASAKVYQNRYHYGAQSKDGSWNDVVYVYDSQGAWSKWTGLRPRHLNVVNQNFVMGDSTQTTGGTVFQLYNTESDAGGAINASWQTKDLALSSPFDLKAVDRIYIIHSSSATTLTVGLSADGGQRNTNYSLNLSTGSTLGTRSIVVEPPVIGNTFRLKFSNNAAAAPWEVLGYGLSFANLGMTKQ